MVYSNKNKNLIYEINLINVGFANSARTMIWCPVFDFIFAETLFHRRKLYVSFYLDHGHHF